MDAPLAEPASAARPQAAASSAAIRSPAIPDRTPQDFLAAGNPAAVLRAAIQATHAGEEATLAWVLETDGSTYARAGAMALFGPGQAQAGWLSGGCLEPELARRAAQACADRRIDWIEIDTRDDAELLSGSALGCRGRLRIALLPLDPLRGCEAPLQAWLDGGCALERSIGTDGRIVLQAGHAHGSWELAAARLPWTGTHAQWTQRLPRSPEVLLLGAGPETATLLGLLRELGWRTTVAERRPRWRAVGAGSDAAFDGAEAALRDAGRFDAALVMHHNFELDRDALDGLAGTGIPFVGLLGPRRRRDDLFKLLGPERRTALSQRLRSPVGLNLGGQGPEAIALSIAAQLQDWRARNGAA